MAANRIGSPPQRSTTVAERQTRFGDELRRLRELAGFSQEELAERAGLSANAISALERGERKRPYPDTIRRLAEALDLRDSERAELAALARRRGSEPPPAAPEPSPRTLTALPGEPTPLIGREREAEVIRDLLTHAEGRLLTLIGPGGVGKTRLALHVARSLTDAYPDGVTWVELAPLADPELVMPTIARAVGLEEPPGGDPGEALRGWLRERRMLLVLDNAEHLLEAGPALAALLLGCPEVRLLVTSRAPLGIRGEQEYAVPPLELPPVGAMASEREMAEAPSVQLFVWLARQKHPDFALTDANAAAIGAICRRLDGLPLALELVAARVRVLGPAELLARLDRLMPLLVGGSRDLPQRQQTMRAAIDWSHTLLPPASQALFRRLSVFAAGWTLEAAEAVAGWGEIAPETVMDLLANLVEQSLVVAEVRPDGGSRYRMLEPIRQFARDQLDTSGEADQTWQRFGEYHLALSERAALEIEGRANQVAWLDTLAREHDNLRAALTWSEQDHDRTATGLRIATSLWRFWEVRGHVREGSGWLATLLARSEGLDPAVRARALNGAGNLARDQADHDLATRYHEQSLAIRRELGDRNGIASSLNNLGVIARDRGEPARTLELCGESLALFREVGNMHGAAITLISLGAAAIQLGDLEGARQRYEESLAMFREEGDSWHTAWLLSYLAHLLLSLGEVDPVRAIAQESLALHRVVDDAWGIAMALGALGRCAQADGDLAAAAGYFGEGLRVVTETAIERAVPACLEHLAGVALEGGQAERAARLGGAAEALREQLGVTRSVPEGTAGAVDPATLRGSAQAAWVAGRGMARELAVAEALALAAELSDARRTPPAPLAVAEVPDRPAV